MEPLPDTTHTRLVSLLEINQLLLSAVEPEDVLQRILTAALQLFAVEGCSLALLDDTGQALAFEFMEGPAQIAAFRVPLGAGIAGWVAQTGEGVISNDVSGDRRWFGGIDRQSGFTTRSILCAPLTHDDRLIGVIEALNTTRPGGFTNADLELLTAFGRLAGTAISQTRTFARLRNTGAAFQEVVQGRYRLVQGLSESMQETLRLTRTVAPTESTVLLLGESGTGKEVVARAIHQWSPRAEHPFVAINCVALTAELLASELFGHERGAFTGATTQKKGKFEAAEGGTLFLDEIGDLVPELQTRLLRVIQEREFQRVGGVKDIRANVRILAATNRDLHQAMRHGAFREDLYYRLNVITITLPPLRERQADIPALVEYFLAHYCRDMARPRLSVEPEAMQLLRTYAWPGNVRELKNTIERAVVLAPGVRMTVADLPGEIRQGRDAWSGARPQTPDIDSALPLAEAVTAFKRLRVEQALQAAHGNQRQAAETLGLPASNLSRLMKTLGLR